LKNLSEIARCFTGAITHEIIEIVQQPRTLRLRASTMWIVRLVGSVATLELKAAGSSADIPRPTMINSFVLVQWHGELSFRETSLMI
jgi:hypothetical protein